MEAKEILFLTKTFPCLTRRAIELKTDTTGIDSGDYFFDIVDTIADEELFKDFFD